MSFSSRFEIVAEVQNSEALCLSQLRRIPGLLRRTEHPVRSRKMASLPYPRDYYLGTVAGSLPGCSGLAESLELEAVPRLASAGSPAERTLFDGRRSYVLGIRCLLRRRSSDCDAVVLLLLLLLVRGPAAGVAEVGREYGPGLEGEAAGSTPNLCW